MIGHLLTSQALTLTLFDLVEFRESSKLLLCGQIMEWLMYDGHCLKFNGNSSAQHFVLNHDNLFEVMHVLMNSGEGS